MFKMIKEAWNKKQFQKGYRWGLDVLVGTGGHPGDVAEFEHMAQRDGTEYGRGMRKAVDEFCKVIAKIREPYKQDRDRLDKFDKRCGPVIVGQTQSWPYGEHIANEWSVEGPFSNVRDAIDAL